MKKWITLFLLILSLSAVSVINVYSAETELLPDYTLNYETVFINGEEYYFETSFFETPIVLENIDLSTSTISGSRTKTLKNSAGQTVVKASVTGIFSYDGLSANCVSCSGSAVSYASQWYVSNYFTSKYNNSATTTATVIFSSGSTSMTYYLTASISCAPDGTLY